MLEDSATQSQIQTTPMDEKPKPPRRPGDLIIDKYMPNATPLEREEARYNLKMYLQAVMAIQERIEREKAEKEHD